MKTRKSSISIFVICICTEIVIQGICIYTGKYLSLPTANVDCIHSNDEILLYFVTNLSHYLYYVHCVECLNK